ncbi:KpsF/GutQ family sugar-phosphate isomerase [Candidatus Pelagibacter sp. RS40]|uniref:KpsF/GutQ family sugar-phosphate isomerase n=1 Tax=Candidatus Pelagibacter sp. RS40 TaxID=1977865 RepID=UPI000A164384|nr:KpsF/GutQ family sugar-phosphate isomerase [Candidatus Pelagibacter sp. RS40]ARJ49199.1 arabinose-5-phosphate isomerase [Candidatus Pelagibacter sp. RS40]
MKIINYQIIAKEVIQKEIDGLRKLKLSIGKSFNQIIKTILGCKNGKVIVSGVGKSGIIGKKWAATFSSTGTPSFFMDASNASHGDMGQINSNDVVILISLSGSSSELKNIIEYCSRHRNIKLIGITSNRNSILYKNSDIKVLVPNVKEAGPGNFVPTSSTTNQLALGDSIAIACMIAKNFGKLDFKKYHPSGFLATKLRTVGDVMLTGNKVPFVKENITIQNALKIISEKGLGVLLVRKNKVTTGILTDGDIKRISQKKIDFKNLKIKFTMKKNPISVEKDTLAAKALEIMNTKRITSLCVHKGEKKKRTIGIVHIHNILNANIG